MKFLEKNLRYFFGATIFLSSFLLFMIQPLVGRYILPWFGGGAAIWTAVMLFFQVILLLGYIFAHAVTRFLSTRWQFFVALVLVVLNIALVFSFRFSEDSSLLSYNPVLAIVLLLLIGVGAQSFLLASISPWLQKWFSGVSAGSPYRLYSLSNAGSLLGLLSYPLFFEPLFSLANQNLIWRILFFVFLVGYLVVAISVYLMAKKEIKIVAPKISPPDFGWQRRGWWFLISLATSLLLLAITNKISQDISAFPLLWVLPLFIYLLSFIIVFAGRALRAWSGVNLFLFLSGLAILFVGVSYGLGIILAAGYIIILLAFCLVLHGELVKAKPVSVYLTEYYFWLSLGGAAGGFFASVVAPIIFNHYYELPLAILLCLIITFYIFRREKIQSGVTGSDAVFRFMISTRPADILVKIVFLFLVVFVYLGPEKNQGLSELVSIKKVESQRNFYGVVSVQKSRLPSSNSGTYLYSGQILHGSQFVAPDKKMIPTTYYSQDSGVGLSIKYLQDKKPAIRVGAVGLGVGTVASYGRAGDYFRFYEINPVVEKLARQYFSFLADTKSKTEVVIGDARLSLASEPAQNFDLLILDAFSGDAIPIHLLTKEAFGQYFKQLDANGVVAIHISNRYIDLRPAVFALAKNFNLPALEILGQENKEIGAYYSQWIVIARDPAIFVAPSFASIDAKGGKQTTGLDLWTDDYSNIVSHLKFK